jgi:hypothetical protein
MAAQPSPYNPSLDKIEGEFTVFVFLSLDALELDSATTRPRPGRQCGPNEQRRPPEAL